MLQDLQFLLVAFLKQLILYLRFKHKLIFEHVNFDSLRQMFDILFQLTRGFVDVSQSRPEESLPEIHVIFDGYLVSFIIYQNRDGSDFLVFEKPKKV